MELAVILVIAFVALFLIGMAKDYAVGWLANNPKILITVLAIVLLAVVGATMFYEDASVDTFIDENQGTILLFTQVILMFVCVVLKKHLLGAFLLLTSLITLFSGIVI